MTTIPVELRELLERMRDEPHTFLHGSTGNQEISALLAEQPQAGAGQGVCDHKRQRWNLRGGGHCSDCGAPVGTSVAEEAARHDQGDEARRLREALMAAREHIGSQPVKVSPWRDGNRKGYRLDDEPMGVMRILGMIDAALTQSPKGEEE